jgi:hypothetical protein
MKNFKGFTQFGRLGKSGIYRIHSNVIYNIKGNDDAKNNDDRFVDRSIGIARMGAGF